MPKTLNNTLTPKYRISEELAKFGSTGATEKRKEIREALKMANRTTLSEWENIKKGDKRIIPFDDALIICRILGCDPKNLLNK